MAAAGPCRVRCALRTRRSSSRRRVGHHDPGERVRHDTIEARGWLLAALAIVSAVGLMDLAVGDETVLISMVIIGPLVASMTTSVRATALVAVYALAWAVANGIAHGMLETK